MGLIRHTLGYFYPELLRDTNSLENPANPLTAVYEDQKTAAKIHVTEENSMSIGSVHACVKVISETMAQMDLEVVEKTGKTSKINTNHPNYWLLHSEPSPYYNRFEWVQGMMAYALLWGNAYSWIRKDRYATAKELKIIPAWEVTPKLTERGKLFYEWISREGTRIIMADDMIHLKNLGTDGLLGFSPIRIQRESIGNSIAKQQHEGAFYSNGAKASGILMTPGTMGDKEIKNVKESFNKENERAVNRFKTIVLEEGVKYQQLTIPQNDAQFLESKKFDRSEIAGWYRVPPYKIGDHEKSTYSNIEGQERSFAKDTIVPWTTRFQQEIDRKLFFDEERGRFASQFNLDDLIKGDIKTRFEVYNIGVQAGMLRPSEGREAEGWSMDNTEEINQFFMNGTMMPVKTILAKPVEPTQPQQKVA